MSDESHAEPPAPAAPKPPSWLKQNLLAAALGLQAVVLVGALATLAFTQPPKVKPHQARAAEEAEAESPDAVEEPAHEPDEAAPHEKEHAAPAEKKPVAKKAKHEAAHEEPAHAEQKHAEPEPEASPAPTLETSLAELSDGNERFVHGVMRVRDPLVLRHASAPRPTAVVVACSDATVPPELVFDQSLGSLVVVRTAAELVDDGALAAVEDAVARLEVPLVVVLGHEGCHAVHVATGEAKAGPGLSTVVTRLKPVVSGLRKGGLKGHELTSKSVDASVSFAASQLAKRSKVLRGKTPIVRAVYDEASGKVRWLDVGDEPATPPARSARAPH